MRKIFYISARVAVVCWVLILLVYLIPELAFNNFFGYNFHSNIHEDNNLPYTAFIIITAISTLSSLVGMAISVLTYVRDGKKREA